MKTRNLFTFAFLTVLFFVMVGCNSRFNEDVMYGTVGNKLEKIAPGEVTQLNAMAGDGIVILKWENPIDADLYGVKLTVSSIESDAVIPNPVTLSAEVAANIPNTYTFYELSNQKTYSFALNTFDKNLNYSSGTSIMGMPDNKKDVPKVKSFDVDNDNGELILKWTNDVFANFGGVTITYNTKNEETGVVNDDMQKISLPKISSPYDVPETYTVTGLTLGVTYYFTIVQFDDTGKESSGVYGNGTPAKNINTMGVTFGDISLSDGTVGLSWENPDNPNFYGIQITSDPAEGSLQTPVYFLLNDNNIDGIPEKFNVTGLTNNKSYKFYIKTIDRGLNLSNPASTTAKPNPTTNKQDIQNFRALAGNGYVDLYWDLPEDTTLLKEYELIVSPKLVTIILPISETSYRVTDLENKIPCSFTIRTIDISERGNYSKGVSVTATPDSGSSGIFDNPDLIRYKNSVYAYDFGYCEVATEKKFKFSSSSQINLTKNTITKVMGKDGVFTVVSAKNITDGAVSESEVGPGQEFEIVIKYTPTKYTGTKASASWDEADFAIGGVKDNTIRLLASNYPQPKSISSKSNELKLWLRADLIDTEKHNHLTDNGLVKILPDYSGNGFDAACSDKSYSKAPRYKEKDTDFNNLPVIDWKDSTSAQLISASSPIIEGTKGSTTFIVFKLNSTVSSDYCVLSANYGTGYPVLRTVSRVYNDKGYYNGEDIKYTLAIKNNNLQGTYRFPFISNDYHEVDNRLMVLGAPTQATGLSKQDRYGVKTLGFCLTYDRTINNGIYTSDRPEYENDLPSNIRMFVNGDERLLAYTDSMSNTTQSLTNANGIKQSLGSQAHYWLVNKSSLKTCYGIYGGPWGDGKGHRHISLGDTTVPQNANTEAWEKWIETAKVAGGERPDYDEKYPDDENNFESYPRRYKRMYDTAMNYNPGALFATGSGNSTHSNSYTSYSDYFENWINTDIWRNGTINTLTLGTDLASGNNFNGRIAEVFIFEGCLSDEDIAAMNNYISYRYDLQNISTNLADYAYE